MFQIILQDAIHPFPSSYDPRDVPVVAINAPIYVTELVS